jgi:hypothetical protein
MKAYHRSQHLFNRSPASHLSDIVRFMNGYLAMPDGSVSDLLPEVD